MTIRCKNCAAPVERVDYGTGPIWVHNDPFYRLPYQICKPAPVAEPYFSTTEPTLEPLD